MEKKEFQLPAAQVMRSEKEMVSLISTFPIRVYGNFPSWMVYRVIVN